MQGFPDHHTDEMPTCALFNLSSVIPVAYNIACEAPCDFGWVIAAETLLSWGSESLEDARREEVEDRERLSRNLVD